MRASVMERKRGRRETKQFRVQVNQLTVIQSQQIKDKKRLYQSSEENLEVTGSKAKGISIVNLQHRGHWMTGRDLHI